MVAVCEERLSAEEALELAQRALDGEQASAEWAAAACLALWRLERYREGYELFRSFSSQLNNDGEAWLIAGMCARRLPDHAFEAEQALLKGVSLLPQRADAHYNLGNHYNDLDRHREAVVAYQRSLALNPNTAPTWHNLGIVLRELDQLDEAARAMRVSLRLDPFNPDVWCNLGLVAHAHENFEQAKRYYLHSIQLDQQHAEGWVNVGMALLEELKPEEALSALTQGHKLDPSLPDALFNMALTQLLLGDYLEGWRLYESRFTTKQFKNTPIPSSGPWITTVEQLQQCIREQRQCLIWSEQGIGDVIQFMRYLPILQSMGVSMTFATRSCLVPLIEAWGPSQLQVVDDRKIDAALQSAPHLALMSLPRLLRSTVDTIPSVTPYLLPPGPPPERLLVTTPPGGLAVGLVWASNPGNPVMYKQKSLPLNLILPPLLAAVREDLIELHSLQVGEDARELEPFKPTDGIVDWNGTVDHFGDTAHVVSQLDLVISVDTAVAHLAAALDRPTWILLPSNADFRWLRSRQDSPWYSSVRLFRQHQRHNWASAVDDVVNALGQVLALDLNRMARERA